MSRDYGVELYLFYGVELFELLNKKDVWDEILSYLEQWKKRNPDFPEKQILTLTLKARLKK